MKKFLLACYILLATFTANAQAEYAAVDDKVKSLGSLDSLNVARIADTLTKSFPEKIQKARAVYYWIANNIQPDLKAIKANDNKKIDPVIVIQTRRATPLGYATLVQEMLSAANIRCLTVDGFVKRSAEDIGNPADEVNHSWNVVQLGQSPDQWHYIDAAMGAGSMDKRLTVFTKNFISEYFFTDRSLFNLQHYPDNSAWQLGPGPKSLKDFYNMPVMYNDAIAFGMRSLEPLTGTVKTKMKNAVTFNFTYRSETPVTTVTLVTGDERRPDKPAPMNFSQSGGSLTFKHEFKKDDEYPVRVVVNDKVVMEYNFMVTE